MYNGHGGNDLRKIYRNLKKIPHDANFEILTLKKFICVLLGMIVAFVIYFLEFLASEIFFKFVF